MANNNQSQQGCHYLVSFFVPAIGSIVEESTQLSANFLQPMGDCLHINWLLNPRLERVKLSLINRMPCSGYK